MDENARIAEILFPSITETVEGLLNERYPKRELPEGAVVTRFAPSPTGFLHIGGVFTSLVAERIAHQSRGVLILRIEDTDKKREVEGGVSTIVNGLLSFGITFDEGATGEEGETGAYGPYTQSRRARLYQAFCKQMVKDGRAYPCFLTEERLSAIRKAQEERHETPGFWGEYAQESRGLSADQIEEKVKAGVPFVMRLKSSGKPGGRVRFSDLIRGEIEMEENFLDIVLLKSDGIPTYHFAHVVDETLMRITHVIRGEEWIASAPIHLELFKALGLKLPKFIHVSPVMKEEDGAKRKLSKRKDPEATVDFFIEQGYPSDSVCEYLLTIANSNFEEWRKQNKGASYKDFPFSIKKMSQSGALFDLVKLGSVSGEVISRMSAQRVYALALEWSGRFDPLLHSRLKGRPEFALGILSIGRGGDKPRKDFSKLSELHDYIRYFYERPEYDEAELPEQIKREDVASILNRYAPVMNLSLERDQWFDEIKAMCSGLGFCPDVKEYKKSPEGYKGHVGDVSAVIRFAVTGRKNTPDLFSIMQLLGEDECKARLKAAVSRYQ